MKSPSSPDQSPRPESFAKFRELAQDIRIAMLTTSAPDGTLHSRPMGTQEIGTEGDLWFFTADDSLKVEEIGRNPHVNVAYAAPNGQVFLSVAGRASLSYDRAKIHALWTPLLKTWFPSGPQDPSLALLRVKIEAIDYWSGPGKVVALFKLAAGAVLGESAHLGEFGKIAPPTR